MKEVSPDAIMPPPSTNYYSIQHVSSSLLQDRLVPPQDIMHMPLLSFTSLLKEDCTAEIVEQSDQMEQIIQTHAEQLRRTLAEKWQRHYCTLLCAAEERAGKRLKEREVEMEKTAGRNSELEQLAVHLSTEAQVWYKKAKQLEETVGRLRAELLKTTMRSGVESGVAEDAESSYVDRDRVEPVCLACKACGKRVATKMMWPCRHVCVCKGCDAVSTACPVCRVVKTTSVEVILS